VPLERERHVSFDKLLEQVASGRSDEDVVATLAGRLASLNRKLDDTARAKIEDVAGRSLVEIASSLASAIDVERIDAMVRAQHGATATDPQIEAVAAEMREAALRVFDDPKLRTLLSELKRESEVIIDDISQDIVISSAYSPEAAAKITTDFREFLEQNRDQLTALRILYGLPAATKHLTYASLEELRDAMLRPPWLLQPLAIWAAYRRLQGDKVRGNPAKTLTDIVALVRFATGSTDALAPLAADVRARFNLWMGREQKAGRLYDEAQIAWLEAIRDHIAANVEVTLADVQDSFADRGGILGARRAFGPRLDSLLGELQDALVA
jgi:type I restriction enzyme R subunit